jgi:hypothetical protein
VPPGVPADLGDQVPLPVAGWAVGDPLVQIEADERGVRVLLPSRTYKIVPSAAAQLLPRPRRSGRRASSRRSACGPSTASASRGSPRISPHAYRTHAGACRGARVAQRPVCEPSPRRGRRCRPHDPAPLAELILEFAS